MPTYTHSRRTSRSNSTPEPTAGVVTAEPRVGAPETAFTAADDYRSASFDERIGAATESAVGG
jgi:hypothetical protein